jgi:acyl carrier protein
MCNIEKKLTEAIVEISGGKVSETDINENSNLIDDLRFDSILLIQLIVEIEEKFNIEINDEDMSFDRLTNLASLKELITKKINLMNYECAKQ